MTSLSKLATVRALLAKAESTTFPAEAEAYTERAMRLMAEHGIDQAMLDATKDARDREMPERRQFDYGNPYSYEKMRLIGAVAHGFGCKSYYYRVGRVYLYTTVVGFPSDLDRIELLYTSLLLQMTSQAIRQRPDYYESVSVQAYRKSWCIGFADAVRRRLLVTQDEAQKASTVPGTALVLANRATLVEQKAAEWFPPSHLEKPKQRSMVDANGWRKGREAGNRADIHQTRVGGRRTEIR